MKKRDAALSRRQIQNHQQEKTMNRDHIQGRVRQAQGTLRLVWGRLTRDHLVEMAGQRDRLAGKLQARRGVCASAANQQPVSWYKGAQG
jgi:uncharacterized protein YjbJ (UPF0337 family)